MAIVRTNITVPEELLRQVDELAGPRGRSAYVTEALAQRVRRDRQRRAFEEAAGVMVGRPGHLAPDEIIATVRALRAGDRDWTDTRATRRRGTRAR